MARGRKYEKVVKSSTLEHQAFPFVFDKHTTALPYFYDK